MGEVKFRPYRGIDKTIQDIPYSEGYVYFAIDTGKIYLDAKGNNKIPMGGSGASLFYANALKVIETPNGTYILNKSELEDENAQPKENDLIINYDGAFYKVISVDSEEGTIECSLLAISGTGGSPGGPGGPGETTAIILELVGTFPTTFIYGQDDYVTFKATATLDALVNYNVKVISNQGTESYDYNNQRSGQEFRLNVGKLLQRGTNQITVTATGENSGSATRKYSSRNAVILELQKSSNFNPLIVNTGVLNFNCMPIGLGLNKTLKIYIDNLLVATKDFGPTISDQNESISVPKQAHGVHTLEAVLSTLVGGVEIKAASLIYEVAWSEDGNTTPLIWFPEKYDISIINYSDCKIKYMVWDPVDKNNIVVHYYRSGKELSTSPLTQSYSAIQSLVWDITDYEVGANSYTISVGGSNRPVVFTVEEDTTRNMNIITSNLLLNLDSTGRSNAENISSRTTWDYNNEDNKYTSVNFNGFNWYNNGWVNDADGKSCLRISNGASIEIPIAQLNVLRTKILTNSVTFEFRFKVRNVREYSTLITKVTNENEDGTVDIINSISTEQGVFGKLFQQMGFCLGTQEAFFATTKNKVVNARYKEDEIVSISFVVEAASTSSFPLIYIYLNGILSGISTYDKSEAGGESFIAGTTDMLFNSDYCDVDLYRVRVYNAALSSAEIVQNYTADVKNVDIYDANQIITYSKNIPGIDYSKMVAYNLAHPDTPIEPYAVVTDVSDSKERLPYVKGGKHAVNVDFVNPYLDYLWETGQITGTYYLNHAPSFHYESGTDLSMNVQGTSSQGYPRRNFKLSCKKGAVWTYTNGPLKGQSLKDKIEYEGDTYRYWRSDTGIAESSFTWKTDYMESTSSYNTGLASYVSTLYSKHPLQDLGVSSEIASKYRSTVYGFPMLMFQKFQDKSNNRFDGTEYQFYGRFNYNLDKACDNNLGFTYDIDSFVQDENGERIPLEQAAESWEFCNNEGTGCSFKFGEYPFDSVKTNSSDPVTLRVCDNFEYRYSYYADQIDDCLDGADSVDENGNNFSTMGTAGRNQYILNKMKNLRAVCEWVSSTDTTAATNLPLPTPVKYIEDKYVYTAIDSSKYEAGKYYYLFEDEYYISYSPIAEENVIYYERSLTSEEVTYDMDNSKYRIAKFRNEFSSWFDSEYCYIYFIVTELIHGYDSRGKNMMLTSFGPHRVGGNYIWYPWFYDIDTQLGINNSGVPTWDYDVEATENGQFSTSNSVLWNNLWECFKSQIKNKYIELRKTNLTIDDLVGYYDFKYNITKSPAMFGQRPMVAINVDEYFKYISPVFDGYWNTDGEWQTNQGEFFYCLQGIKELQRYLYLRNRFNYIDSWWKGGSYSVEGAKQQYWSRYDANAYNKNTPMTSDKYLLLTSAVTEEEKAQNEAQGFVYTTEWPQPLDTQIDYNLRSFLKQYMFLQYDDNQQESKLCDGKTFVNLPMPEYKESSVKSTPNYTQQLLYIGGGEYIADLGDLSLKYLDEIKIPTLKRLENLVIGNDNADYFNAQLGQNNLQLSDGALDATGKVNENAKTLLKKIVLSGLTALDGSIDVSGSEKLEEFRALRTKISGVGLADGVQIKTLHLPNTITSLSLVEPTSLQKVISIPSNDNYNTVNEGLYIDSLTNLGANVDYTDKKTLMQTYNIIGGNLGYGSYKLLEVLVKIKTAMQKLTSQQLGDGYSKNLAINLKDVKWSPYTVVQYGESYDDNKNYFIDNGEYALQPYTYDESNWAYNTLNNYIYEYDATAENSVLNLDVLKTIIDNYKAAVEYYNNTAGLDNSLNYFTDTSGEITKPTIPSITGLLYVNNANGAGYSSNVLLNEYGKYFPDLKIFCAKVTGSYTAEFVSVADNGTVTVEHIERLEMTPDAKITYPDIIPVRLNHDFLGWSLNGKDIMTKEEIEGLVFSSTQTKYRFYAVFELHKYKIYYYNIVGNNEKQEIYVDEVPANEYLKMPPILPSTDESMLADEVRYKFLGFVTDPEYCYPATESEGLRNLVVLENILSENMDREFYACYIQESVYASVTSVNYFNFTTLNYVDTIDSQYSISGYTLSPKPDVILSGKLTLPKTYNNMPIVGIAGFSGLGVTHIYFEDSENVRVVSSRCFAECKDLKIFDYPLKLREIGSSAFEQCTSLKNTNKLGDTKVYLIESSAFNQAFAADPIVELRLPGTLRSLRGAAFSNNRNLENNNYIFTTVSFGGPGDPSNLNFNDVGPTAFVQNVEVPVKEFYFYKDSSSTLDADAFFNYINNTEKFFRQDQRCDECYVVDA